MKTTGLPIDDPLALGQLIRQARREQGVTQIDAAGWLGVSVRWLSEVERGKATAEVGKVFEVLRRLGFEVWIFPRGARARSDA
ncbi:MAG: helix-turn-helix transcriptional regulator [Planctomycetes bacterium]|nr:helix-turn-helix transcriptional regulator [Planctomycetota bacterium]